MALILTPRFPDRRRSSRAVEYTRTGRAAKRRGQLARKRARERAALVPALDDQVPYVVFTPAGLVAECNGPARELFGVHTPGAPLAALLGSAAAATLLAALERSEPQRAPVELAARTPDGVARWLRLIVSVVRCGELYSYAALAEDLTAHRRTERLADVLAEAARILTASTSAKSALDRVMRAAVERLEVDFAATWCVDPRTRTLRCAVGAAARGEVAAFDAASRARAFEAGIGLPGRVWRSGSAAWIPDLERDDNFPRMLEARGAGLRSGIAVPVRRGGRTIGAVELFTAHAAFPDPEFLRRLGGLGDLVGLVLDPEQPGHFGFSP